MMIEQYSWGGVVGLAVYISRYSTRMQNGYQSYQVSYAQQAGSVWPYVEAKNYSEWESIFQSLPHLRQVNSHFDIEAEQNVTGMVIRSANDDNVHKAIKYGIWTTTPKNRGKIEQLWQRKLNNNLNTYLFFSAVKSGMFEGVARLTSGYHEETFPYWWENHTLKFKGFFQIEWVYIKDINNKHFAGLYNQEGEDVTKSKDCDTLDSATTRAILNIYDKKDTRRNIFMDFAYMDEREALYVRKQYENYYNANNYQNGYDLTQFSLNAHSPPHPTPTTTTTQPLTNNPLTNNPLANPLLANPLIANPVSSLPAMNPLAPLNPLNPLPPMMGLPATMLRPNVQQKQGNSLGFQMNPISRNKKK